MRFILALDWQPPSYRFVPHAPDAAERWLIPALTEGDYYLFLEPDLRWGVFSHPWEQTMWVFGADLLGALGKAPPRLFAIPIRHR